MKKCEIIVDRLGLTALKGSIVYVDDRQFEAAKQYLKPLEETVSTAESLSDYIEKAPVREKRTRKKQ